jgi:Zn-dependent protease/CBS domain-containing protein
MTLGTFGGTQLKVHATFFLLLIWIVVAGSIAEGLQAALINMALIIAIFGCVVLHEFGHAAMARRFGIKTPDITLLPIGGMARLERFPDDPREEILIALAGPAVNVVIWLALTVLLNARVSLDLIGSLEDPSEGFLARLATVNLVLVVFNMIPAFPMDGGRVFRAFLAVFMDRTRATTIAAHVGQAMAFLFGLLGLTTGNPLLILIAIFVFFAAGAEGADVDLRSTAAHAKARDAMISLFETVGLDDTLETASMAVIRTTQSEFPVLDDGGKLLGVLTRNAILSAPEDARHATRVRDAMTTDIPAVLLDDPMQTVVDAMSLGNPSAVAVTDQSGAFLGYITRENVGEWYLLARR